MAGEPNSASAAAKKAAKWPKNRNGPGPNAQTRAKHIEMLPWAEAITDEDPFSFISGGTEGGFLSLEEIGEDEYGLVDGALHSLPGSKKRKERSEGGDSADDDSCVIDTEGEKDVTKGKKKKKKPKPKKKKKKAEVKADEAITAEGEKGERKKKT